MQRFLVHVSILLGACPLSQAVLAQGKSHSEAGPLFKLLREKQIPNGYVEFLDILESLDEEGELVPGLPQYHYYRVIHDSSGRYWAHQIRLTEAPKLNDGTAPRIQLPKNRESETILGFDGYRHFFYKPNEDQSKALGVLSHHESGRISQKLTWIYGISSPMMHAFLSEEFSRVSKGIDHMKVYIKGTSSFTVRDVDGLIVHRDEDDPDGRNITVSSERAATITGQPYWKKTEYSYIYRLTTGEKKYRTRAKNTIVVLHASSDLVRPPALFEIPFPNGHRVQDNTREGIQFDFRWSMVGEHGATINTPSETSRGSPAPNLDVQTPWYNTKEAVTLGNGKITVVEFWANWCAPCIQGLRQMEKLHKKHREDGVQFVSIHSADLKQSKLAAMLRNLRVSFPVAQDAKNKDGNWATFQAYGAKAYPSVFIVDGNGNLQERFVAPSQLEGKLAALLHDKNRQK